MKRILLFMIALLAIVGGAQARKMSDLKIYINPGHGGYTSNDRPINIHPYPRNDTLSYWESKSNLYKGLHMYHILDSLGTKAYLSRTKNTEDDDRSLSGICAEANSLGVDLMLSIHSNAGETVNYPLMLYREETEGTPRYPEAIDFSKIVWRNLHSSKLPVWSHNTERVAGDLTFYRNMWQGGLGVLRTLYVVGMLSEGSMHEHRPEAHRLMNDDVLWLEAWHFVKSIMEFFNTDDRFVTGNVAGIVYDNHNLRETVMPANFTMLGRDKLAPLNGTFVELLDASGKVVQKRTTDNDYNGAFVFRNVTPGKYTVRAAHDGYYTLEKEVEVTACEVAYQDMPLDMRREFPLQVLSHAPAVADGEAVSCASTIDFEFNTDIDVESFEKAFKIEPAVEGYFTYEASYHKASFHPNLALELNTHYTVTLAKSARHPDPFYATPTLADDFVFGFDTKGRNRLEMTAHFPDDGGEIHFNTPTLEFQFDRSLDPGNIFDVVKVTDSKGTAVAVNKRSTSFNKLSNGYGNVIYVLNGSLTEGEQYTVRLTTELRDRENLPLSEDVVLHFTAIDATRPGADAEVMEDFEAKTPMFEFNPDQTSGIGKTLPTALSSNDRLIGKAAAKLTYKFTDIRDGVIVWNYIGSPKIFNRDETMGVHINGNFTEHELLIGLQSGTDVKYVSFGKLNYRGWQYKEAKLDMLEAGYPYELVSVKLVQATSPLTLSGNIGLDNITRRSDGSSVADVIANSGIEAWPVPARDYVHVSSPADITRIELVNLAGAVVAGTGAADGISVAGQPAGIYLLRVHTTDNVAVLRIAVR